jgi:alkaline phosphatase
MYRYVHKPTWLTLVPLAAVAIGLIPFDAPAADLVHRLQSQATLDGKSPVGHWGSNPDQYSAWTSHSNRLIPVYTFGTAGKGKGIDLASYTGEKSLYRDQTAIRRLYRAESEGSLNPDAEYMDQTDIFQLQLAALTAGKKHIFLVVFDGMDWDTTRNTAIWNLQRVAYTEGRGTGTHFQDYTAAGTTQFGFMVTSPHSDGTQIDVNTQKVKNPQGGLGGGYDVLQAGPTPWDPPRGDDFVNYCHYVTADAKVAGHRHAYTDSSSSATSMTAGIKTYNGAINVDNAGNAVPTIAHHAQAQGYRVGAVSSVPISHATPGAAYAHNVDRDDYQDIARDMLGLPSSFHPEQALPGLDVLVGCGWGVEEAKKAAQGENFVPGNIYIAESDLEKIDIKQGGKYVVAQRTPGYHGARLLEKAAADAVERDARLFGLFGIAGEDKYDIGHLPYASADGDFQPAECVAGESHYTVADITENPTLADMTRAAIRVLHRGEHPFWLLVEPGDVDWANHANNLDASIGAVNSGDAAVRAITDWVEANSNWDESVMIVTADHGHLFVLQRPELLVCASHRAKQGETKENVATNAPASR